MCQEQYDYGILHEWIIDLSHLLGLQEVGKCETEDWPRKFMGERATHNIF